MIKKIEYCSKKIDIEFNKPLVLTKKGDGDFNNSTKSWICKIEHEEGEVKIKDHDHVTGNY